MKNICLFFQIHHPLKLKTYRFFNMGNDAFYLDEYLNRRDICNSASKSYLVANEILQRQIELLDGKFKVTFAISGVTIEQFKMYAPEVIESFKKLAATGCVDFLAETYSHSLAALASKEEFVKQVERHAALIESEFGVKPTAFNNSELIYSDGIGQMASEMGYQTVVTEGAKHILGWKSSGYVYANPIEPKQHLLLRNSSLCDDIRYRFSEQTWDEWPLSSDKYASWVASTEGDVANVYIDYETFGVINDKDSGVFEFLNALPVAILNSGMEFKFADEIASSLQPISALTVPHPISWADEEKDITLWLGNELQREAFEQLYSVRDLVSELDDKDLNYVWDFLQSTNHFCYMNTKWTIGDGGNKQNQYDSPYEAFINYMNVVSDFKRQVLEKSAK